MNDRPARELSPDDGRVLDQLAEDGFDPAKIDSLSADDRPRGEAIAALLGRLEQYPVEDASPELVDATLARIQREEDARPQRMRIDNQIERQSEQVMGGRRWRFPDLFATAAIVLIAVAVIWPITNSVRQQRMVALDSANLGENGQAMALYASAHDGMSPMQATASVLPDPFDWMGKDHGTYSKGVQQNMAGYASSPNDFQRPESKADAHPYSYQYWQPGDSLLVEGRVVAANANPLRAASGRLTAEQAIQNSLSHGGKGQNILFGDGSVSWTETCDMDGDRLWDPGTDENGHIISIIVGGSRGQDVLFLVQ